MADWPHLRPKHRRILEALLREHLQGVEVWAHGSRVNERDHDGSDLDLVLRGPDLTEVPSDQLVSFEEAAHESSMPFLIKARDWAGLPESFQREIERDYVKLSVEEGHAMNGWLDMPFTEAVLVNPTVRLKRGRVYPFVNMAAVDSGSRCVQESELREYTGGGSRFQDGDILMARITPCLENGKIARYCKSNTSKAAHGSTEFIVIRGRPKLTDTEFAYYLTRWDEIRNYAIGQMTGTSGRQRVPTESLRHLNVSIPPISEQRVIARILGALDAKVEFNMRMNETIEAMAQAVFQDWFVDFGPVRAKMNGREPYLHPEIWDMFPDRLIESEVGEMPEGWELSEIGKEVEAVGGATPNTKESSFWKDGRNYWVTPKDLSKLTVPVLLDTDRKITDVGVKKIGSGILPTGTVLLSSRAPIGYLAVTAVPTSVNQGFIAMICEKRLPNVFVLFWCRAHLDHIKRISGGSTFAEISKRAFRPIPVVVPSVQTVSVYECAVRSLLDRIIANTRESTVLAQVRDCLLPRLMSGELCVPEAVINAERSDAH